MQLPRQKIFKISPHTLSPSLVSIFVPTTYYFDFVFVATSETFKISYRVLFIVQILMKTNQVLSSDFFFSNQTN
jgi:hypothetical protein